MFQISGEVVFEESAPFDELDVLKSNYDYLLSTLDLSGIDIKYSDDAEARIQEDCCPQEPFILYRTEPSVPLLCINQQLFSSCFEVTIPVYQNDSVKNLSIRLAKEIRNIKGTEFLDYT